MSIKDGFRNFFGLDEETETDSVSTQPYEYESEANHKQPYQSSQTRGKVIPMAKRSPVQKSSIHILEPRVFSEAEKISDYLIHNESVLLNFKRMEHEQATKVIDFIAGTVYAIGGDMKQVGEGIFLCAPADVEIARMETEEQRENYYY